jgi:hypothetical protein
VISGGIVDNNQLKPYRTLLQNQKESLKSSLKNPPTPAKMGQPPTP